MSRSSPVPSITTNLRRAIEARRANYADLTPSVARLLKPSDTPSLKTLVVAGEALTQVVVDRWADHVRLINVWYGCVETD